MRLSKSLAEFAARRRQSIEIIFSRDMCVGENTAQAASVEFVRRRRTNYARGRPQAPCRKNPKDFSNSLKGRGVLFLEMGQNIRYNEFIKPTEV